MASQEVVEYIKQEMRAGHAPLTIKKALVDVGWSQVEIDAAMTEVGVPAAGSAPAGGASHDQAGVTGGVAASADAFQSPQPAAAAGPSAGSALERNLASRAISSTSPAGISAGGLQARTAAAPANIPTQPLANDFAHVSAQTFGSPQAAPVVGDGPSRLAAQSTGASISDFTGGAGVYPAGPVASVAPAGVLPAAAYVAGGSAAGFGIAAPGTLGDSSFGVAATTPATPALSVATIPASSKKAGSGWYILIGFLLGVLVTVFSLGAYIYFAG